MADLLRDSALGFLVRLITRNKFLSYEEDRPGFQLPKSYQHINDKAPNLPPESNLSDTKETLEDSPSPSEQSVLDEPSKAIVPTVTSDGTVLVDWYSADDPANPQNWSFRKKCFIAFQICIYTFAVYIGSAIYTPSQNAVTQVFGVSITAASLGLAMYVLGYGTGPLLFAPISEIPVVGRNPPYIITFALFVILCVPTALVKNFGGLLVLRFLQGFFGSPCLATGGASFGDIFNIFQLPFLMAFWTAAATAGPSLGPTIAGYTVQNEDWRWPLWEMLWIAGPVFILLFICLPETSASNILLRRAARLRKLTGNNKFHSQGENDQKHLTASTILIKALVRPAQIIIMDPAITFVTIYTCLTYGVSPPTIPANPLKLLKKTPDILLLLRILPPSLHGQIQLQPRRNGHLLPLNRNRHANPNPNLPPLPPPPIHPPPNPRPRPPRRPPPPRPHRLHLTPRRPLPLRLDLEPRYPLDRIPHRRHNLQHGHLRRLSVHLHLHPPFLSAIRSQSLRRQRTRSFGAFGGGGVVCQTAVYQSGYRAWRQRVGWSYGWVYSGDVCVVVLGRWIACEE